jgi:hypothetical protein
MSELGRESLRRPLVVRTGVHDPDQIDHSIASSIQPLSQQTEGL